MKPAEAIKRLKELPPDQEICIHWWIVEDVQFRLEEQGPPMTLEEKQEVLSRMNNNHDPSIGHNWTTLDAFIETGRYDGYEIQGIIKAELNQ